MTNSKYFISLSEITFTRIRHWDGEMEKILIQRVALLVISIYTVLIPDYNISAQDLSGRLGIGVLGSSVKMIGGKIDQNRHDHRRL